MSIWVTVDAGSLVGAKCQVGGSHNIWSISSPPGGKTTTMKKKKTNYHEKQKKNYHKKKKTENITMKYRKRITKKNQEKTYLFYKSHTISCGGVTKNIHTIG